LDKQWLARCQSGDEQALRELVDEHQAYLLRFCISILNDRDEAEDAVQEAFIAAIKNLSSFRQESAFRTWLSSIALNVCRGMHRKRARQMALGEALVEKSNPPQNEPGPEGEALHNERQQQIWESVASLDEKHRMPIILHYYHDLPTQEIAEILGIRVGTVHSRLANARKKISGALLRAAQ
jgi:RNA polymerase sigma-70 factor (ECF subfamily)